MLDSILFDLDGTLLPMDMNEFMDIYFREMCEVFKDITEPKLLVKNIWTATAEMVRNVEPITNEEVFINKFNQLVNGNINEYMKRFDYFYDTAFHKTREAVKSHILIKESIEILKKKNYKLVIATNPLFPRKAIYLRINWAGLNPEDFEYITCYEANHYCKPQLQYYKEVLEIINRKPEQCLMVGNDVQEDMIAGKLGMQTFLITDHIIHRTSDEILSTYKGDYNDFYTFVKNLEPVLNNG